MCRVSAEPVGRSPSHRNCEATETSACKREVKSQDGMANWHLDEDGQLAAGLATAVANMASLAAEFADARTCFHAAEAPPVDIEVYAARLHQYLGCSGGCYVLALVYLDRLVNTCPESSISPLSCHRLLLISLVVAAKFHDDVFYSNEHYAIVGGVQLRELNRMEAYFIELLGWDLLVQPEEYETYNELCEVASHAAAPMPARCL